jgi:hypothetical protein
VDFSRLLGQIEVLTGGADAPVTTAAGIRA